ncbi:MAG: ABC transporter substrate-binding protein [Oscillospiraceae bacterium]
MKKIISMILALSMSAAILASCGGTSTSGTAKGTDATGKDLPVLRVATMPAITSLPAYFIKENKLDEKNGFKMETTNFATGAPMNEALAADLWDVGAMGAAAVTGVANYDEMVIGEVLESTDGLGVFVKPDSPIAKAKGFNPSFPTVLGSPETVKGITILTPVGTAQHFTTLKWLEKLGLESTDVSIVNMDTVQAYQAMQAGQCDAVALNVPTFFNAKTDGMVQVGNLAELGTKYVDMLVANRKAVEGKAELVQKYVDANNEACAALKADPKMAADLLVKYLKECGTETSLENCVSDLGRVQWITKDDWKDRELGRFARELGEFYVGLGQLEPTLIDKFNTNIVDTFVKK